MPDAMGKLSDEEMREPDVHFHLTLTQFYALPRDIQEEVRHFETRPGWFRAPAYRYRHWLQMAKRLEEKGESNER